MSEPVIDAEAFGRLVDMAGGDREFVAELIDTYLEDGARQLDELEAAMTGGDVAAIVRPAHSLKTGSQNVGATAVADLAEDLEADARNGSVSGAPDRLALARDWFGRTRDELLVLRDAG